MTRALFAALLAVVIAGCATPHTRTPARPPLRDVPPFAFEAVETIDVARDWGPGNGKEAPPAVELAAADGASLPLKKVDARAVIYGPIAFTELHLFFLAPPGEPREGTFAIELPYGASVARFALLVGSAWQEAEVVELAKGRAAQQRAARQNVKTALLEETRANRFRGRLFPIAGDGRFTHVVISYTETVSQEYGYGLRLRGLPKLDRLDVQVLAALKRKAYVLRRVAEKPAHDFWLEKPDDTKAIRAGDFAIVRTKRELPSAPPVFDWPAELALLVDTSASCGGPTYSEEIASLLRQLKVFTGHTRLHLAAFDQEVEPLPSLRLLESRRPGGATDIERALSWAVRRTDRVLLVTDGRAAKPSMGWSRLSRVDVLPVGDYDRAQVEALARSGKTPGLVLDHLGIEHIAIPPSWRGEVTFPGAKKVWPRSQPFHDFEAALELEPGAPLEGAAAAPAALVERAVAQAKLRELDPQKDRAEILALSKTFHLLTPLTGLLMLHDDAEYMHYGATRATTVPTISRKGFEMVPRGAIPAAAPRPFDPEDEPRVDPEVPARPAVSIEEMAVVVLPRIPFDPRSATLSADAEAAVDRAAQIFLQRDELSVIGLFGHTAPDEPAALAEKRALAVRAALVKRGLPERLFLVKGLGATRPERAEPTADRRVELRVLATRDGDTGAEPDLRVKGLERRGKPVPHASGYRGALAEVMRLLTAKDPTGARNRAEAWLDEEPTDRLAWIAYGNALVALGDRGGAARAYGSLLDLAETAEDRRAAGGYLDAVGEHELAYAAHVEAERDRPEQLASQRALAWSLARRGNERLALERMISVSAKHHDEQRFPGHRAVLERDVGLLAAMVAAREPPSAREDVWRRAKAAGAVGLQQKIRYGVLTWEDDGSDLDLVGVGSPDSVLSSAGHDVKQGYGPELLLSDEQHPRFEVHLQSRGPNKGPIVGKLTIFEHDGRGRVRIEDHPFAMNGDHARFAAGLR